MEQENRSPNESDNLVRDDMSEVPVASIENPVIPGQVKTKRSNRLVLPTLVVVLLFAIGSIGWFLLKTDKPKDNSSQNVSTINSYEGCVSAGYPVMESSPEKCSVPGGQTFTNEIPAEKTPVKTEDTKSLDKKTGCSDNETKFADKKFGASFCYPSEWGTASVVDAKIDTADAGYREAVRFSANTKFIVGGTSENWTTTVGRDVGCQEPNNYVPELASYDTVWHNILGEGIDIDFATRSIVSSEGGYDITENVSRLLDNGVCVQGHKVINGSRYKVLSEAYLADFSEPLGVTTPKAHIDNSNVLFSAVQRAQFDALLASAVSYQ